MPVPAGTFAVVRLSTILWPYFISSHHNCQELLCSSALSTGPGVIKSFNSVISQTQLGTASMGQRWTLLSPQQIPTHTGSEGEQRLAKTGDLWGLCTLLCTGWGPPGLGETSLEPRQGGWGEAGWRGPGGPELQVLVLVSRQPPPTNHLLSLRRNPGHPPWGL